MKTYTDTATKAADRMIDVVRKADDIAVKTASFASQRIGRYVPDLRGSIGERMPKPEEYVRLYFDFVERLVKTQRTYAMDLVRAFRPVTRKIWSEPRTRKAAA